MTVIAAIALDDRVVMGCDTRTDYGGTGVMTVDAKIAVLRAPNGDKVLLGAAGNGSLRHAVVRSLALAGTPDPDDLAEADDWAAGAATAITWAAARANPPMLAQSDGNASGIDGTLLLAWRQHLWWVYTHAAVRPHPGVLAIGSGTEVALGSLHTSDAFDVEPGFAIDLAIRLACRHADGCGIDDRGPIIHWTVD